MHGDPRAAGNISSLASSEPMPVPSKADFDKVKQTSAWSKQRTDHEKIPLDPSTAGTQPVTPSPIQRKESEKALQPQRENLARVYSALILNHLVPSTALELHLLVRLLNAKESSATPTLSEDESNRVVLQSLFISANCCQSFAIDVLTRVKCVLRNLPLEMVEGFVNCPPFASMLPDVSK